MKARLVSSGWFVGFCLIGYTSGLSPSLRGKDDNTNDGDFDTLSQPILQERQRSLRSKGSKGSKKSRDTGIANFKKSSKKGGTNKNIFTESGNNVDTPEGFFPPADTRSVPTNDSTSAPTTNNNTAVPINNNTAVPINNNTAAPMNNDTALIPNNNSTAPTNSKASPQLCFDNIDCSNNACGYETLESKASGQKVCCPSGNIYKWSYPSGSALDDFCTQPVGAACSGDDRLCISGICAGSVCVDAPQPDGHSCKSDSDCIITHKCGRERAQDTSPLVCCPAVMSVFVKYSGSFNAVCAGQPTGAPCGNDSGQNINKLCASGLCVSGMCT